MRFDLAEDQSTLLAELGKLLDQEQARASTLGQRAFFSADADTALERSGFLDVAEFGDLGPAMPALVVHEIAARNLIVEAGASCLLRPALCPDWPRPLAVIVGHPGRPTRFLREARSVLFIGDDVRVASVSPTDSESVAPFYAYPMAGLVDPDACLARARPVGERHEAERLLLVATAAEMAGALSGALAEVTEHVSNRRQFGRPIGSFQAVQHRLAACATQSAAGKWLALRAASTGSTEDALVAAGHLQAHARTILYDLHQFMGAMGLTLEHPLYGYTYRVRLLMTELGGAPAQFRRLAETAWG